MVEVRWESESTDLKNKAEKGAVGKVLRFYRQALASVACPVHETKPWLQVQGQTLEGLTVHIATCCPEALGKVHARLGGVSRRDEG